MCRTVPAEAKAEGNLWPWLRLEFPVNAVVTSPSMVEGHRPGVARIHDDRVFCGVPCLLFWVNANRETIDMQQDRSLVVLNKVGELGEL
jgi:hypothetical protein